MKRNATPILFLADCRFSSGYPILIHERLADVLLRYSSAQAKVIMSGGVHIERFRHNFYSLAAADASEDLRRRFLARYPTPATFTAQAFKELLGMSSIHPALGFDGFDALGDGAVKPGQERTVFEWLRLGSALPDVDRRNQDRWWAPDGKIRRTPQGTAIPFDPVVLNMGGVAGLTVKHTHTMR